MNQANEDEMLARFASNLGRLRTERRLSQVTLAARSEMHSTQINRIEKQRGAPSMPALLRLAGALEHPLDRLFDGISYRPPAEGRAGVYLVDPLVVPDNDRSS